MPPYSASTLKRKYSGKYQTAGRKMAKAMVRKSYVSYPVYSTIATAPAPTRVELKYDYGEFNTLMKAAGTVILLSTIPNGNGSSERVGRRIQYHDIEIGWHYRPNATYNNHKVAFMIVYDSSPNGALPSYLSICQSTAVESFANSDTRGRYSILYRSENISTNNTNGMTYCQGQMTGRKVISLKNRKCHFLGTGATIADVEKGAIYLVTQAYADDLMLLEFVNRIQYSDA